MKDNLNKREHLKEKEVQNAKEEAVCQLAEEVYFVLHGEYVDRNSLDIFDIYVDMICELAVGRTEIGIGLIYTLLVDNDYEDLSSYVKGFILGDEDASQRFINHFGACSILDRLDDEDDEDDLCCRDGCDTMCSCHYCKGCELHG